MYTDRIFDAHDDNDDADADVPFGFWAKMELIRPLLRDVAEDDSSDPDPIL